MRMHSHRHHGPRRDDPTFEKLMSDRQLVGRMWVFIRPYFWPLMGVYGLYLANSFLNLLPLASLRYYFDTVVSPDAVKIMGRVIDFRPMIESPRDQLALSGYYFAGVFAVIIIANVVGVIMHRAGARVIQRLMFDLKRDVNRHMHKLSVSYFDQARTGGVLSRTVGDVEQLEQMVSRSFDVLYAVIHFVTVPAIMLSMSPLLFLFVLPPLPIIVFTIFRIRKKLRPMYKLMREQRAEIGATVAEQVSGIREIKAFGQHRKAQKEYARNTIDLVRARLDTVHIYSVNHQLLFGAREFGFVLLGVGGGALAFMGWGNVTLGMIIAFLPLLGRFYHPIHQLVGFYDVIQRGMASAERVFAFLDTEPEVQDKEDADRVLLEQGAIRFEDVNFHYNDGPPILKNVDFEIKAGEQVAVVGPTGAGKSTLAALLMRFYQPQTGRILIDDHDVANIAMDSIVAATGMVFQDTFLFYGTIADNIRFSKPNATNSEVQDAAQRAEIASFIESLPDGYDTMVGERGIKLSGGQRQRVTIARMILKDPAIIILDEATSSVDTETERAIQEQFDRLMHGRTSLVIAHRLSTIRNADKIIALDEGRVVEMGRPDELLDHGGRFAQLVEASTQN